MAKRGSQSPEWPLSAEDSALKWVSWCHCQKNAQFSIFFNRQEERHQPRAIALTYRGGGAPIATNATCGFVCPAAASFTHDTLQKVRIALIDTVVFIAWWDVGGPGVGARSDWTRRLPLVSRRFRFEGVLAHAQRPLSSDILFTPEKPRWPLWMSQSHSESRMQVAGEKTTFPRRSRPLECHPYGAEEALTPV